MPDAVPVVVAYPGVSGAEALGALAALEAAGMPGELVSSEALVPTREDARLVPHRLGYATLEAAPVVVLPHGDASRAAGEAALVRALRARAGRWLVAGGDALRLAHAAGLLEGRRVARLPGAAPLPGAREEAARVVADGRVLTCLPGDALVDLVLHYVAREAGDATAARAAAALGREHRPFVLGGSQA